VDEGEKTVRRRQPLLIFRAATERDQALPGEGEPESSAAALGWGVGVLGCWGGEWEKNGKERERAAI
jgi:hypothetical protein